MVFMDVDKYPQRYDTMKIKEILSDDQLYEMCILMTDAIWAALDTNYSASDFCEGYPVRRRVTVRPIRRVSIQRPPRNLIRKPVMAPAHRDLQQKTMKKQAGKPVKPVRTSMVSKSQATGLNPRIDPMNGPNFKLDDRNIMPKNSD